MNTTKPARRYLNTANDYLSVGFVGGIVAALIWVVTFSSAPVLGFLAVYAAGFIFAIGVIAKGVEVGIRSARAGAVPSSAAESQTTS